MVTERNILTIFAIHTFFSYSMEKKDTIKAFTVFLKRRITILSISHFFSWLQYHLHKQKGEVKEISWFFFHGFYDEIIKIKEYEYNNNTAIKRPLKKRRTPMSNYTEDNLFDSKTKKRRPELHCCRHWTLTHLMNTVKTPFFGCDSIGALKAMIEAGIALNHTDCYGNNALFSRKSPRAVRAIDKVRY